MKVNSLSLLNFRNYEKETFEFYEGLNLFIGRNGQGKTNLLEALSFMSSMRSFRVNQDRYLIADDKAYARLEIDLETDRKGLKNLVVLLQKQGKSLLVNRQPILSSKDFITHLQVVLFTPADMNFFDDSPRIRRREIDVICGKLSPLYLQHLLLTNKLIRQRNALLKNEQMDVELLEILTEQVIDAQLLVIQLRHRLISFINQEVEKIYHKITGKNSTIRLVYKSDVDDLTNSDYKTQLQKRMKQSTRRDKLLKATTVGIQRDDLETYYDDVLISNIASQGQKRLVILSIKLALAKFIEVSSKQRPILIMDDVFSELDGYHQRRFMEITPTNTQIFITTTDYKPFKKIKRDHMVFEIEAGKVKQRRLIHG